jgi:hypothetical protein
MSLFGMGLAPSMCLSGGIRRDISTGLIVVGLRVRIQNFLIRECDHRA